MKTTPSYFTHLGAAYCGDSIDLMSQLDDDSINLVITSPPFALQREKDYGNVSQADYVSWLTRFAKLAFRKLKSDGSFVIDIGGAYEKGAPVRSLYPFRALISFCDTVGFKLAEEFYWNNPSKLPSPIEWVNKRKIRVKDSVNTVWWLSKSDWPKADVRKVLAPYSDRMKKLLKDPAAYYDAAKRPSGHDIGASFGKDNGGAIPPNLLNFPNSESNSKYMSGCRVVGCTRHPARFPSKLPEFFIKFLTDPGDVVLDIFSGSNTTGEVAESLDRRWMSFELDLEYVAGSVLRFVDEDEASQLHAYRTVKSGASFRVARSQDTFALFETG